MHEYGLWDDHGINRGNCPMPLLGILLLAPTCQCRDDNHHHDNNDDDNNDDNIDNDIENDRDSDNNDSDNKDNNANNKITTIMMIIIVT